MAHMGDDDDDDGQVEAYLRFRVIALELEVDQYRAKILSLKEQISMMQQVIVEDSLVVAKQCGNAIITVMSFITISCCKC
jgi:hypothetical protein